MRVPLVGGIMNFCGIENADLKLMVDALDGDAERRARIAEARQLGREFG